MLTTTYSAYELCGMHSSQEIYIYIYIYIYLHEHAVIIHFQGHYTHIQVLAALTTRRL